MKSGIEFFLLQNYFRRIHGSATQMNISRKMVASLYHVSYFSIATLLLYL